MFNRLVADNLIRSICGTSFLFEKFEAPSPIAATLGRGISFAEENMSIVELLDKKLLDMCEVCKLRSLGVRSPFIPKHIRGGRYKKHGKKN